ncbi:MAG: deaminase, partial [Bacteroidales bacterium]|nr:deaminase [Bacteroidales bacterium]
MMDDVYYMRKALMEAESAMQQGEVPVGAVIVCNNEIIGRG